MERNQVLEILQRIIREVVDDEEVRIDDYTIATDIDGWDSLSQVLIVGELQNEFGVRFTSSDISGLANVGELVDAIINKL